MWVYLTYAGTVRYQVVVPWVDAEWSAQLRRGALELCILALISRGPRYGYEIVQDLASAGPIAASEGTVYPLLRRVREAGWVETYWSASEAGPPRQYYRLTAGGRRVLTKMGAEWRALARAVNDLVSREVARASA